MIINLILLLKLLKDFGFMNKKGFYEKILKRPFDFFIALLTLIILSPLLLVIAILVRIKLGSPVFFKQERPGLDEKIFTIYKFRTMNNIKDENGRFLPDIERLTSFGKFLRSTSIDELPALINIIKGNMSFVGPRPLLVEYLPYYSEEEKKRHSIRPGITGLAQINGRNNLNWDDRLKKDLEYMNNISFVLDLKILFKTALKVIRKVDVAEDTKESEGNLAVIRSVANIRK